MSLINQMLQDLDARQAAPDIRRPLPSAVRSLPVLRRSPRPYVAAIVGALALLAVWAAYSLLAGSRPSTPPSVPAVVAASLPAAPAAPAPAIPVTPAVPGDAAPAVAPIDNETPRPVEEALPAPVSVAPVEKKSAVKPVAAPPAATVSKTAKPSPLAGATKSEPTRSEPARPEATGRPPKVVEPAPPVLAEPARSLAGKPPKGASIERSDVQDAPAGRAETAYRKAIGALNQGRVAEAVDELRAALRDDALHRGARQLLIKLLLEARRLDEAIAVLQEGLQGQPAQTGWAMSLARLQVDRGDLAGAWKTLDDALPAAGQSADYQGFAAHVLQRLGRQREAIARYQAATRLAPGDGRWWLGLGLAHEAEGNTAEAREAFARARQSGNLSPELAALAEQKLR